MTLQEMRIKKKNLKLTNQMIADKSGIPLSTVQKIFAGCTYSPRKRTLLELEQMFASMESSAVKPVSDHQTSSFFSRKNEPLQMLRETEPAYSGYPRQGSYTIDDYYALPDEKRAELIDGCFYDMAAPDQIHQLILGELFLQISPCVEKHPGCRLYFSPLDVCLDKDAHTIVQPDLLIVCDYNDRDGRRINGAPDFVAEILSPASRYHDMFRKLEKYRRSGVREYWIIDPEKRKVAVYDFETDDLPDTYSFDDTISLRISEGTCAVNFKLISEKIQRYNL